MKHSIALTPQGIIEMKYVGPISDQENMDLIKKSYNLITARADHGKPALVLVDLSGTDHLPQNLINARAMRDSEAVRIAGFGVANETDRKTALDTVAESGAGDHVRLFDTREQALEWLVK